MENLDHLFTFPIIMIDGATEDKKEHNSEILGLPLDEEVELIEGEACIPYYDFISVSDRWLPTDQSLQNAVEGKFEACGVLFAHSGTFIVPQNKKEFMRNLSKFILKQPKDNSNRHTFMIESKGLLDA